MQKKGPRESCIINEENEGRRWMVAEGKRGREEGWRRRKDTNIFITASTCCVVLCGMLSMFCSVFSVLKSSKSLKSKERLWPLLQ
jgi:hypothetical protein